MQKRVGSEPGKFSWDDAKKVGISLLVVMIGAGLTYLEETVPQIDLGSLTPVVVAANSAIVEMVRRWLGNTKRIETKL